MFDGEVEVCQKKQSVKESEISYLPKREAVLQLAQHTYTHSHATEGRLITSHFKDHFSMALPRPRLLSCSETSALLGLRGHVFV